MFQAQFAEDHSIIYNDDGSVVIGRVIFEDYNFIKVEAFNDTINLPVRDIDYRYKSKNIGVVRQGRFHVISGYNLEVNVGASLGSAGAGIEFALNKKVNPRLSLGISLISQSQSPELTFFDGAAVRSLFLNHNSTSFSLGGKYYVSDHIIDPGKFRGFAHLRLGHSVGQNNALNPEDDMNAGVLMQYGLGVQWANRKTRKYFIQFSQIHQKVDGNIRTFSQDGRLFPVEYDLWLNNVMFSFGCEFNIALKSR